MDKKEIDYTLYAITDRSWVGNQTLEQQVEQAIRGGATIVQLREKNCLPQEKKALALKVQDVCKQYQVPFIVNDDVMLAKEIEADGVHIGQDDMQVQKAREILGENAIIGVTAKTVEQATAAQRAGADYLGSGALFGSHTKTNAIPMTFALFDEICESVTIPVVAIGGINEENVQQLHGLKMDGIAVVSAIFAKEDIEKSTRELYERIKNCMIS